MIKINFVILVITILLYVPVASAEMYHCKRTSVSEISEKEMIRSYDDKEILISFDDTMFNYRFKDLDAEERSERILFQTNKGLQTENWMFVKERGVATYVVRNYPHSADYKNYISYFKCD